MKAHEVALRLSNQRGVLVIKTRAMSKYRQVDGEDVTRGAAGRWRLFLKDLSNEVLLLVARHRGDGRHRGACGRRTANHACTAEVN